MNFEKCKKDFADCIAFMNVAADHKDVKKNLIQFGRLQVFAEVLKEMGHTIDGSIVEDEEKGARRVIYMTLDGQKIGQYANNAGKIFGMTEPEEESVEKVEP